MIALSFGVIALAAWLYLAFGRANFWRVRHSEEIPRSLRDARVAVIVPARDEAAAIEQTVAALVRQDYWGDFRIILVDDQSSDGTAELAREAARREGQGERLHVIESPPLPEGWTGKLWALEAGIRKAAEVLPDAEYFLLTDADILHPVRSLSRLVTLAESGSLTGRPYDLVSLMARLHCVSTAEKLMIPAFVFFFRLLYPFERVNKQDDPIAAAAGGVMLVARKALEQAGGIAAIRGALIDDCALAAALKRHGQIWIGLSSSVTSLRAYEGLAGIWNMVARTAFTQLRYSPLLLIGTILGMCAAFLVPPLLIFHPSLPVMSLGAASFLIMAGLYFPTVRFYRLNLLWALALPVTALLYTGATVDSARRYRKKRGGEWKGRIQAT